MPPDPPPLASGVRAIANGDFWHGPRWPWRVFSAPPYTGWVTRIWQTLARSEEDMGNESIPLSGVVGSVFQHLSFAVHGQL